MIVLLTGVAGFVGYHVAERLLADGIQVIGVDVFNDYYDVALKEARIARLTQNGFTLHRADIADRAAMTGIVQAEPGITHIVHLAAQAGVRYSMVNPYAYVHSNVMGHLVVLEAARLLPNLRHLVYASSSSVYGLGVSFPLEETGEVNLPTSLYAATKRADELISHAYTHLYALPQTGLRFFTVYGPWGRPDMAYYGFAQSIMAGRPITLYEGGTLKRDFTYIDDIVAGVVGVLDRPPPPGPPRVLNIGNNRAEPVTRLVSLLEKSLGRAAIVQEVPRPAADVVETWASVDRIAELAGYAPSTPLDVGIPRFVEWFQAYHGAR
ncbi:NAD-dependent epimerase/dehydratase family protein [Acidisphaera sp. L21]|uniref:NAD-dependent epimerase/dehydratase family protein n=1 Tax=Acidisphaera sp. L21 TaxID=1641851 RepID=UPI00131A67F0|nr:NAD-dependent epimerase/dehydratase family protein [Acidisphaera sp. L21]